MISESHLYREVVSLNDRAAKAEYALEYERARCARLINVLEEIYLIAFDMRYADIANKASDALRSIEAPA